MNLISQKITTPNQNLAISAGIFILAVSAIGYFILWPTIDSIIKLRGEILTIKMDMEQNLEHNLNINKINEKFEIVAPQMEKLNQVFINRNREVEFITSLEGLANDNNVSQQLNLEPTAAQTETAYKKIPTTINAQGSFNNILRYLYALENSNYYINIDNIELANTNAYQGEARPDYNNSSAKINIKINGFTYWQ